MAERSSLSHSSLANKKNLLVPKRTSSNTIPSISKGALLGSSRKERVVSMTTERKSESMTITFLQYCAMCENQITTPCSSLLYCSEACHDKDSKKPLSAAMITSTSNSLDTTPTSPRSILQPRTPTGVSLNTNTHDSRIPPDNHSFKPDLDPTEWKPKSRPSTRPASSRYNSEAFRYLSSFHRVINRNNDEDPAGEIKLDIPSMYSIAATAPQTPSLGNTPTTTASSSWSLSTSAGAEVGNGGYSFNTRPLMPRHNRWYSTSSVGGSGHGIDLVTPHVAPPPDNDYVKRGVMLDGNKSKGGLDAFFGGMD